MLVRRGVPPYVTLDPAAQGSSSSKRRYSPPNVTRASETGLECQETGSRSRPPAPEPLPTQPPLTFAARLRAAARATQLAPTTDAPRRRPRCSRASRSPHVAAAPAMAGTRDKRAAAKLLRGTHLDDHPSGNVTWRGARPHACTLCRDNTYVLVTSFLAPIIEDDFELRPSRARDPRHRHVAGQAREAARKPPLRHGQRRVHDRRPASAAPSCSRPTKRGVTLAGVPAQVSRTGCQARRRAPDAPQ